MPVPLGVSLAAHALGGVDWQATLRRTGMPFRSPAADPRRSAVVLAAAVGSSALASAAATAAALAVARVPAARAAHVCAPAVAGLLAPLPVVGVPVSAAVDTTLVRRAAAAGADAAAARLGTSAPTEAARTAPRSLLAVVAYGLVHETVTTLSRLALDRLLPAPPRPAPAPVPVRLDVRGPDVDDGDGPEGWVVYLDGVGRCERRTTPVGRAFAAAVADRLPRWHVVLSLMPNDVAQVPAWQRPVTGPLWRRLHRATPAWLIARGVWEAVVALDPRYRDRLAEVHTASVVRALHAAGYRTGSGRPVVLVGLSGGAQTALRSASEVARALGGAPLDVVTFGAFADGSADLDGVRRVHAAVSWGDPAELLPVLLFPSRWTALGVGAWRRAKRSGRVVVRRHDYATHIGPTGYLSGSAHAPDGRTRLAQAADLVARAAHELSRWSRASVRS